MPLLFAVLALVALLVAARLRRARIVAAVRAHLTRFAPLPALGTYAEGLARIAVPGPKRPHAVLLIHGFSAAPAGFDALLPHLGELPCYAPALTGFGLDDFALLEAARGEDWRRDVFAAYDVLAAIADEVSIVAFSFGTLPACELARERPVRHLVLIAPYFHLQGTADRKARAAAERPWARALAKALIAWIPKPVRPGRTAPVDVCAPGVAERIFHYPALPVAALIANWRYPRAVAPWRCRSLHVLWGEQEQTADVPAFLADLDAAGLPYAAHPFPASGHNLMEDLDGPAALATIAGILKA